MASDKRCELCGIPAEKGCSVCKASFYCCSSHQAELRKFHKLSCHESNFSNQEEFSRQPAFQDAEQNGMLRMHQMELVPPKESTTIESNFFVTSANSIFEQVQDLERNQNHIASRGNFMKMLTASELYQLFSTTSLSPFYSAAKLDLDIRQLNSTYCTPFHTEHLLHEMRMRDWIKDDTIEQVPQYLVDSLVKLESICQKLEIEGINIASGKYRAILEMERERIEGISSCRKGLIDVNKRNNRLRAASKKVGWSLGDPLKAIALELDVLHLILYLNVCDLVVFIILNLYLIDKSALTIRI